MTETEFEAATGRKPKDDDMARVNCRFAGKHGHLQCGWCDTRNKPRFEGCHHRESAK